MCFGVTSKAVPTLPGGLLGLGDAEVPERAGLRAEDQGARPPTPAVAKTPDRAAPRECPARDASRSGPRVREVRMHAGQRPADGRIAQRGQPARALERESRGVFAQCFDEQQLGKLRFIAIMRGSELNSGCSFDSLPT